MAHVVEINGRKWVAGMAWASYEDLPTKLEISQDAERLKSDWYSIREGENAIQGGFCEPVDGIKRPTKLFSLAAMLADSREQPWLGIFRISDDLYWYVAVRDAHAILPDGDQVGSKEEIEEARDRHSGYTDWKYISGDLTFLADLIKQIDEKPTPVKSLTMSAVNPIHVAVLGALAIAVIGGGYFYWSDLKVKEEQARQAAMELMRKQLAAEQAPVAAPPPLLTMPEPDAWLDACASHIETLPLSLYGWTIEQVNCDQNYAVVTWSRTEGATVAERPQGQLSPEGEKVVQSIPLDGLDRTGTDTSINMQEAEVAMRAWAQAANIALSIVPNTPPPLLPGAEPPKDANGVPLPPPPPQSRVKFDTPVTPFLLDFYGLPGLRLVSIKSFGGVWTVEGTIYGK